MKKSEPQSLREVLEEAILECDMQDELMRVRASQMWRRMVGESIAAGCGRPFFRGDVMFISVRNAALRHELTMSRTAMITALNNAMKKDIVADIRFIGGEKS